MTEEWDLNAIGLVALSEKGTPKTALSHSLGICTQRKGHVRTLRRHYLQDKKSGLTRNHTAGTLILDFQNCEKINFHEKINHPVYGILLQEPTPLRVSKETEGWIIFQCLVES